MKTSHAGIPTAFVFLCVFSVLSTASAEPDRFQVVPTQPRVGGQPSEAHIASVRLDNIDTLATPGLVILASGLDIEGEAAVAANGRIRGTQDPETNDGSVCDRVLMPPQDGLILLRN